MFESNPTTNGTMSNGVVRLGDLVASTRTLVIGVREYTAYVWGKRMPRTNESRARAAYNDLQDEVARMGDPSPLLLHERFLTEIRVALAAVSANTDGDAVASNAWFVDQVKVALDAHDTLLPSYRAPGPEYQAFLNRLMCALVEGLSPLQADLMNQDEVSTLLDELHYPGFWKGDSEEAAAGKAPTAAAVDATTMTLTTTTLAEENPIGST